MKIFIKALKENRLRDQKPQVFTMNKLIGWIFIIIGVIYLIPLLGLTFLDSIKEGLIVLCFLVIGIIKITEK